MCTKYKEVRFMKSVPIFRSKIMFFVKNSRKLCPYRPSRILALGMTNVTVHALRAVF